MIALPAGPHAALPHIAGVAGAVLVDQDQLRRTVARIAHEIVERHADPDRLALVGHPHARRAAGPAHRRADRRVRGQRARPRHAWTSRSIATTWGSTAGAGGLPVVGDTVLDFDVSERAVILVDDVLFTGRTIRAAIDAIFDYGRPAAGPARGAGGPRPPGAADPARLRGEEPADRTVASG